MIGLLKGSILYRNVNHCIVDVGGVGYEVWAPTRALDAWERSPVAEVHVSTQVREDSIALYGFQSPVEKQAFHALIGVAGIGPKVALSTLDALTVDELVRAVETDDLITLARIRGVGKKTAQRLALDLKGKIEVPFTPTPASAPPPSGVDTLGLALERLGYGKVEIEVARRGLADQGVPDDAPAADRLRAALRLLYAS